MCLELSRIIGCHAGILFPSPRSWQLPFTGTAGATRCDIGPLILIVDPDATGSSVRKLELGQECVMVGGGRGHDRMAHWP